MEVAEVVEAAAVGQEEAGEGEVAAVAEEEAVVVVQEEEEEEEVQEVGVAVEPIRTMQITQTPKESLLVETRNLP